jgi:hypothetical protein
MEYIRPAIDGGDQELSVFRPKAIAKIEEVIPQSASARARATVR